MALPVNRQVMDIVAKMYNRKSIAVDDGRQP
jgi:hypothetical protein